MAASMAAGKRLRLCLIGCGRVARRHASGLRRECSELIDVVACVDTHRPRAEDTARFCGSVGCRVFLSVEEALAWGDFDAVDIMVLHHLHEDVTLRCLRARKHVLLEKPMAPTLEACERMLAEAEAQGRVFMVAEQSQYFGFVLAVQRLIQSGAVGQVSAVKACWHWDMGPANPDTKVLEGEGGERPWRFVRSIMGGGIAIDGGAHWLRPLRMLAPGDVESVAAVLARPYAPMEGESLAMALVRFSSGALGSFEAACTGSWRSAASLLSVLGSHGEVHVSGLDGEVRLYTSEHPEGKKVEFESRHPHGCVLRDFAEAVLHGLQPPASAADSLGELRAALAMYRSQESGHWEPVWGSPPGRPRSNL